jgi:hypothetical protein
VPDDGRCSLHESSVAEHLLPLSVRRWHTSDDEDDAIASLRPIQFSLRGFFRFIGWHVVESPRLTILMCICFVAVCTLGLLYLEVNTDPFTLWVPQGSRSALDKQAYDKSFGPFYRIEQLIITSSASGDMPAPILTKENIELVRMSLAPCVCDSVFVWQPWEWLMRVEATLDSICYKPFGQACAIESVAQYWQMDRKKYESGRVSLKQCLSHWSIDCRCSPSNPPCTSRFVHLVRARVGCCRLGLWQQSGVLSTRHPLCNTCMSFSRSDLQLAWRHAGAHSSRQLSPRWFLEVIPTTQLTTSLIQRLC